MLGEQPRPSRIGIPSELPPIAAAAKLAGAFIGVGPTHDPVAWIRLARREKAELKVLKPAPFCFFALAKVHASEERNEHERAHRPKSDREAQNSSNASHDDVPVPVRWGRLGGAVYT